MEKLDEFKEEMKEAFLDNVFGAMSKLPKEEYMNKVVQNEKWIFQSKSVRSKVEKFLKEK